MLKTTRKNNIVIMAMIILLSIMMAFVFCNFNVALAEENPETDVVNDIESYAIDMGDITKSTLNVGVKGTLADGNRTYGEYYMEVCVKRLDSTTYKIETMLQVNTLQWKTDRYKLKSMSFRYYGENIQLTKRTMEIGNAVGQTYKVNNPENGFTQVDFTYSEPKKDNFAWVKEEITAKADGTAKFIMEFNQVRIEGIGFAKTTTITSPIAKVRVQPSPVMGMYQPYYVYNSNYVSNPKYTTQFGSVPSDWKMSASISAI